MKKITQKLSVFSVALLASGAFSVASAQEKAPVATPKNEINLTVTAPRITGAQRIGARPGNPVFHFVSAIGEKPLSIDVKNLPEGLKFDPKTQCITGKIAKPGSYKVEVSAKNKHDTAKRELEIVIGEDLQLTPPMAWNSWYGYSEAVSDKGIREIAEGFKTRGLRDYGWTYVNIDDCWQGVRGGKYGAIMSNERFPDMKALCDFVHDQGVKIGIYSTPFISTYAGFIGGTSDGGKEMGKVLPEEKRRQKHQFYGSWPGGGKLGLFRIGPDWLFDKDVKQWADWGFDYVKIDWMPNDIPTTKKISESLRGCGRDIVLSLSNAAPFKNVEGLSQHSQLWRTTGDIKDSWGSISNIGFNQHTKWAKYQRPGAYNDPDMLQVGDIGTASQMNTKFRPSKLTYEEQRTQVSLWCMLGAPLIISCDVKNMSDETFALLCNCDLLDIHQDVLCIQGTPEEIEKGIRLYTKPLANGGVAYGYFNLNNEPKEVTFKPKKKGSFLEVWTKKTFEDGQKTMLPAHGCAVFVLKQK